MAGVEDPTTFVQKTTGIPMFVDSRANHTPNDPSDGVPDTENRRLAWPARDDRTGGTIA
jgi:hypothetical protein